MTAFNANIIGTASVSGDVDSKTDVHRISLNPKPGDLVPLVVLKWDMTKIK